MFPFRSPKKHVLTYDIRVSWGEDGRPVTQTRVLNVTQGGDYRLFLIDAKAKLEPKKADGAHLSSLSAEDRALAEQQKYCAVHPGMKR